MIDEQVNSLRKHNDSHQTHIPICEKIKFSDQDYGYRMTPTSDPT
jgi:hypothetical protein